MKISNTTKDFSVGSISGNILRLAVPMTLAQLINVLYNIVDRIYIGHIPHTSAQALTGIGLTLPVITIITAFANLFGMGGAPLFSMARGRGEHDRAEKIMGNSFSMLLITGAILAVICYIFEKPLLYLFGASDTTYPYAKSYIMIYLIGTLFVMISLGMNNFINAQGFGVIGMLSVSIGAVLNLILDPVFIFVLHMGVKGAQPVMSFNYGAKKYDRVKSAIKFTTITSIVFSFIAWGFILMFPETLIRMFSSDTELIAKGVPAMHMYFFGIFLMALQFSGQSVFVALGKSKQAVFFSLFRKAIIVIPLTLWLPTVARLGTDGVFWAEPISNLIGGAACFTTMMVTVWRRLR